MTQSADLKDRVRLILIDEAAPGLGLDSSAIEVLDVCDGVVRIRLGSVCCDCPSTLMTMIHGLEQELRCRIPEVKYLEVLP